MATAIELDVLKRTALRHLRRAEDAMRRYGRECEIGPERTRAFEVCERIRTATGPTV